MSFSQNFMGVGCPTDFQRDLWFVFPAPNLNLTDIPCNINTTAFEVFLILYIMIFGVAIFLSFLAATFQTKPIPRRHLLAVSLHSSAGLAICVGTLVRNDFYALGNDGFWVSFALYISSVMAHSLLMTDTMKKVSLKTAPKTIRQSTPIVDQLMHASILQQVLLAIAGIQVVFILLAFLLIIPARISSTTLWSDDPEWYFRKEFLFCLGCLLAASTTATFIGVPVLHTYRVWRYCKDMRNRTKSLIRLPSSPRIVEVKKTNLDAVNEHAEEEEIHPGGAPGAGESPKADAVSPISSSSASPFFGLRTSKEGDESSSPIALMKKIGSSISRGMGSRTDSKESLTETRVMKRRPTQMEVQRHAMLDFQHKMLQATILGIIIGTSSVVIMILMCDTRLLGPIVPLMFICFGSGFFLQFFIINLYFPENLLHERFVKLLPLWLQDMIDGVPLETDSVVGRASAVSRPASKDNVVAPLL